MPRKLIKSLKFANDGAKHTLKTQRNVWIHLFIATIVLALAIRLQVSLVELAVLILVIALVITTEILNTAIEEMVNLVKPELHPQAAIVKNVAAAAVFVAALCSIIVGLMIFLPRLTCHA